MTHVFRYICISADHFSLKPATDAAQPASLAPGETGNLHIAFDSGAHGPELTGPIMRRVILVSNDPTQPEASVDLQATILPPVAE